VGINAVLLSVFIAYRDMKAWDLYREKHLKDLEFREFESKKRDNFKPKRISSLSENNYYFELPRYRF
jgi:hypothetical protein